MSTDLSALPPIDVQLGSDPDLLLAEITSIIARHIADHPRSQQTRLGPSEIGDPCARRLAYKLTGTPKTRELSTPWRPTVGTAVHAWLEEAFATYNQTAKYGFPFTRWLLETSIDAGPMAGDRLTGHSDMYDRVTCTAIDWKGLSLDTPIPTPSGWATIASLRVGDEVFDAAGNTCRVVAKSPVFTRPCYALTFDDGARVIADNVHEWPMLVGQDFTPRLLSTEEAASKVFGEIKRPRRQLRIKNSAPINTPTADLPVPPYTLGAWLGDGTTAWGTIGCDARDAEIFDYIGADGFEIGRPIGARGFVRTVYGLLGRLRAADLIGHKHVPETYLRGSVDQRLALLQGLMDTDGTWNKTRNEAVFSNTDKGLSLAVAELAHSLGWKSRLHVLAKRGFGVTTTSYDVSFVPSGMNPFRLKRKADLVRLCGSKVSWRRGVVSITPTATVPTQCIEVDSPDNTFLCGEQMIPTHNCIGPSAHRKLRADLAAGRGPRREYQVQLHTYGLGYVNRGLHVDRVMLIALPAAGELDDALMWCAPWDRAVAEQAMARVDRIHALTSTLGPAALTVTNGALRAAGVPQLADGDDEALAVALDGHGCRFCPWLRVGADDPADGCPGADTQANTKRFEALIA